MRSFVFIVSLLLLSACNDDQSVPGNMEKVSDEEAIHRSFDFAQLRRGGELFQQNCAVCHGNQAQGAVNWQQRDAEGKFPAPPLNGTGHAWHHPKPVLIDTIKKGTQRIGGSMPPWQGKLSDSDIKDIIAWFQAKWPDELYAAWYRRNQEALATAK